MCRSSLSVTFGLFVVALGLAPACGDTDHDFETFAFDQTISAVHFDVGTGSAVVAIAQGGEVVVEQTRTFSRRAPETRVVVEGETLDIWARCHGGLGECDADFVVYVPASVAVDAEVGTGAVRVDGVVGPVDVTVGTGQVTASELGSDVSSFATGTGDISVTFATVPTSVDAVAGTGSVDLAVPPGAYALDVSVGTGSVNVTGVVDDATSTHAISAHTGTGSVTVRAR